MEAMKVVKTPVGRLWIVATESGIWGAELSPRFEALAKVASTTFGRAVRPGARLSGSSAPLEAAEAALARYFDGKLDALERVPLDLAGTNFQRQVWKAVKKVRPGRTTTYKSLADKVGLPGAFRAVGAANGSNQLALFIPCHRIVASDGSLRGYGGGVQAKSWLLRHEGVDNDGARLIG